MAQCTMHLIIVSSLLLIATVITAFHLRDLSPQVLRDSQTRLGQTFKSDDTNPQYEKCDKCESDNIVGRESLVYNRKIKLKYTANDKTYSEIKQAVKEKQNLINLKKGKISEFLESNAKRKEIVSQISNEYSDINIENVASTPKQEKNDLDISSDENNVNKKQHQDINNVEHRLKDTDSSANVNYYEKTISPKKGDTNENSKNDVLKKSQQQKHIKPTKEPKLSEKNHIEEKSIDLKNQNRYHVYHMEDENSSDEDDDYEINIGKITRGGSKDTHPPPTHIKKDDSQTHITTTKTEIKKEVEHKSVTDDKHTTLPMPRTEKSTTASTKVDKTNEAKKPKRSNVPESLKKEAHEKPLEEHHTKIVENTMKNDHEKRQGNIIPKIEKHKMRDIGRKQKVSDALFRKNLQQNEFEDFLSFFPTFAPNYSRIHNPECRRHGQILVRQLRGTKLWALQMLDSSAKIPSGLLRGNGNQLGDFDQCLASQARVRLDSGKVVRVRGKYCLAHVDIEAVHPELNLPVHLALGRNMIRSSNTDPGHFVPRFSSLSWAICMPAACGAEEAEFALHDALRHYNGTTGIRMRVHVHDNDCRELSEREWWYRWIDDVPTPLSLLFFLTFALMVTYATVKDFIARHIEENVDVSSENKDIPDGAPESRKTSVSNVKDDNDEAPIQLEGSKDGLQRNAFSLYETSRKIFKQGTEDGEIECIHGVRAVCSIALLMAHKLIPLAMTPFTNRIYLTELSNSPLSIILRASLIYTDSFLLLSGVLTAYHISQDLNSTGFIPWLRRYIARYIRLTPALLAVLVWYAWVAEKLGDGPQWGSLVVANADLCRESLWKNILYIQNFFPFEKMCAPHTHQLALDMQLTMLAPGVVWLLQARPLAGLTTLTALHTLSIYLRYSTTIHQNLSLVIYHGITSGQLYRTANLSYTIALHRATPYITGVSLGVLLRQLGKQKTEISKIILYPGWLLCTYLGSWTLYAASHTAARDYRYDVNEAALYAAHASLAWALCLSWIIFACSTGNGGILNSVLCAQPLVIISRLSYAMYLCQFLVFFYNVGSIRTSMEFNIFSFIDIVEVATILAVSIVITTVFIIPMQSLQKRIMSYDFGNKEEIKIEMEEAEENSKGNESAQQAQQEEDAEYTVEEVEVEPEEIQADYELDIEYEERDTLEGILEEEEEEYDEELADGELGVIDIKNNNFWEQQHAAESDEIYEVHGSRDPSSTDWELPDDDDEEEPNTAT